jgi:hypothetical protein
LNLQPERTVTEPTDQPGDADRPDNVELADHPARAAARLRLGLALFVFSWLPIAQVVIAIAGMHGAHANEFRAVVWTTQWLIGLLGLALAGRTAVAVVKGVGWRRAPKALWRMLRTGQVPRPEEAPPKEEQ